SGIAGLPSLDRPGLRSTALRLDPRQSYFLPEDQRFQVLFLRLTAAQVLGQRVHDREHRRTAFAPAPGHSTDDNNNGRRHSSECVPQQQETHTPKASALVAPLRRLSVGAMASVSGAMYQIV